MENFILLIVGFIYGAGGVLLYSVYKEVREMKQIFEQILSQMQTKDYEETNDFM
ncbi:hypothetical protein [Acidianus bottle-shaped virus]|uniref:Uncharacterized protein ORF53b n=1 Tax=Acidianus bottle-shaped virus (isolate Italy/Pozzuoli) TaxID=654911 RepID=Y053B_ABVP|nr:hypothetical protein ABV_gp21 [Acidianus bottle-shaped virus]A4ZUA7.1 RecName: Full=Uncharacterized protein ORF53b [Acidianus bottle-shaped virus (isolate Pozzuoli)]ABP73411.1 hypothetical protein [Acidianus bottle-shaped virus]